MKAREIIDIYISFFEKRGHKRIPGAPLVPENDPTTLFISSGMQPLVPYLLGESHPSGTRLVDVQNVFRTTDVDEVGDDRHLTFYRMIGNWSLGDYFKTEQIPWMFELYTKGFGLDPKKLYVSVFEGYKEIPKDEEAAILWKGLFENAGVNPSNRIYYYGVEKNWWSRSGTPEQMPEGEPGGPDTELFYDFGIPHNPKFGEKCHPNCDCGRFWEIGNSVFMQYIKQKDGSFKNLPKQNVDFGGGLERIIGPTEHKSDIFETSDFSPTIQIIEKLTSSSYKDYKKPMQIVSDHLSAAIFLISSNVKPSNKEQGYILRRLIRRALDNLWTLNKQAQVKPVLEQIVEQYKDTDPILVEKFEEISLTILSEKDQYEKTLTGAKKMIQKEIEKISGKRTGDEIMGEIVEISADTAFKSLATYGLGPTQLKSLGYTFDDQALAEKIKEHQNLSRTQSAGKFKGGLADTQELTVKGHTATHLLHQAIRDMLGSSVHQTGSNITTDRVRFDFNFDRKLTPDEIKKLENTVNEKIKEDLPVRFEMLPLKKAKEIGAIGLFDEKYSDVVKVYFIGDYSIEFCGGPHVNKTSDIKSFKITKQESLGKNQQRIYAVVS